MTTETPPQPVRHPKPYGPVAPPPSPSLPQGGHFLRFESGSGTRSVPIEHNVTHIGRDPDVELCIDDHRVSRDHAVLVRHGRHMRLIDNRSANGTFVNGRRIETANLQHGDAIQLGPVELRYLVYD